MFVNFINKTIACFVTVQVTITAMITDFFKGIKGIFFSLKTRTPFANKEQKFFKVLLDGSFGYEITPELNEFVDEYEKQFGSRFICLGLISGYNSFMSSNYPERNASVFFEELRSLASIGIKPTKIHHKLFARDLDLLRSIEKVFKGE